MCLLTLCLLTYLRCLGSTPPILRSSLRRPDLICISHTKAILWYSYHDLRISKVQKKARSELLARLGITGYLSAWPLERTTQPVKKRYTITWCPLKLEFKFRLMKPRQRRCGRHRLCCGPFGRMCTSSSSGREPSLQLSSVNM